MDGKARKKT